MNRLGTVMFTEWNLGECLRQYFLKPMFTRLRTSASFLSIKTFGKIFNTLPDMPFCEN